MCYYESYLLYEVSGQTQYGYRVASPYVVHLPGASPMQQSIKGFGEVRHIEEIPHCFTVAMNPADLLKKEKLISTLIPFHHLVSDLLH